eukprot:2252458-Ditylum_brightwellii.AAC.1
MGHVFSIPIVRVSDLADTLKRLSNDFGITTYASVIDVDADLILEDLPKGHVVVVNNNKDDKSGDDASG